MTVSAAANLDGDVTVEGSAHGEVHGRQRGAAAVDVDERPAGGDARRRLAHPLLATKQMISIQDINKQASQQHAIT